MRKKILFITYKITYGGAGKIMAFLANKLSNENYDIHLLTYENNETGWELTPGVHHIDFQYSPIPVFALRRILQIFQVRKVIGQIQPDIIISFLTYPNIISIIASLGTRTPVIISERGNPYFETGWFTPIKDFVYNFANGYVFQTHEVKSYYNKRIQSKAVVIPNPITSHEVPQIWTEKKENTIVNVGRFELQQKRQDILIQAFAKISDRFPNIKLVFWGDGEDEPKLRKMIVDCKLENRVVLAGVTKNVCEAIKMARMFVLSSDYEGIPNALIEAMSVGLTCISTDCSPGGAAELITNMENGILVKPGCIDDLTNAMMFILNNPDVAERLGNNARNIINKLTPDLIINQWKDYIDKQIQAAKTHR